MEGIQEHFKMTDGFSIFYRKWPAAFEVRQVVVCLHGIEAHSGAFGFMGKELSKDGTEVYAFDRRGFGNSTENSLPRGDTSNFKRHLEDLKDVIALVREEHKDKKIFLFSHSVGCAYALWFAANYSELLSGLVLAAPPITVGFKLSSGDTINIPILAALKPHSMFDLLDHWPDAFKESEEYKLLSEDPFCTKDFSASWLFNVQTKLTNKMLQNASKIEKPVLILQGDADIIALPKSAEQLINQLKSTDKKVQMFPGADHWFFHALIPTASAKYTDEMRQTISTVVKDWLNSH